MAKKSNKTEHVLKLITKDEDTLESFNEKEKADENDAEKEAPKESGIDKSKTKKIKADKEIKPSVTLEHPEDEDLKYEAKLKIEIQPEIEIKQNNDEEPKKVTVNLPEVFEGSAFIEKHGHLVNIAEALATERVEMVMGRMKVCSCSTCVNDVLAMALNSLPTKYVTTDAGKQYFQLDIYKNQYETDILAALTKACVRVKACPRHK